MTEPGPAYSRVSRAGTVPKIASEQLMKGKREVLNRHGPDEYRLRVTRTGKLILTK
jgi:hemin uptake protein HemP